VPAFERLRQQGKTRFLGLTAIGDTAALHRALVFDSAQVVYNMLNPSGGRRAASKLSGTRLWTTASEPPEPIGSAMRAGPAMRIAGDS
jgi:hypothetical protein